MTDEPRIFRYIVRYDAGTAPNPYDGHCTLSICKPRIRRTARVGDWIVGFRSRRRGEVIYAMQVGESITFADYWRDARFRSRRPDEMDVPTDNIYRPVQSHGETANDYEWVKNNVHGLEAKTKDLSGQRALVANRFWYFGRNSPAIHPELLHLAPVTQGHVLHAHRKPDDIDRLINWLESYPAGMHGDPIDREF